nr:hypothetical protein CFP56_57824 [Quercus suber]
MIYRQRSTILGVSPPASVCSAQRNEAKRSRRHCGGSSKDVASNGVSDSHMDHDCRSSLHNGAEDCESAQDLSECADDKERLAVPQGV